jgi:hypothetical protein
MEIRCVPLALQQYPNLVCPRTNDGFCEQEASKQKMIGDDAAMLYFGRAAFYRENSCHPKTQYCTKNQFAPHRPKRLSQDPSTSRAWMDFD